MQFDGQQKFFNIIIILVHPNKKASDNHQFMTLTTILTSIYLLPQRIIDRFGIDNPAFVCYLFAVIFYFFGFLYVNENNIQPLQSSLSRGICLFCFNFIWVKASDFFRNHFLKQKNSQQIVPYRSMWKLTIRNSIITVHGYAFALSQFYLPLPIVHTIYCSGPIYVFILDYLLNGVTVNKIQIRACLITFLGVLLVVNGVFIYSLFQTNKSLEEKFISKFEHYLTEDPFVKTVFAIGMCLLTLFWSYAVILSKQLQNVEHFRINFHFGVIMLIVAGLLYPYNMHMQKQNEENINTGLNLDFNSIELKRYLSTILWHGIILAISQTFFIVGLTLTKKTGIITMIGFFGIILGYFISVFRYHQQLNIICVLGSILIVLGVTIVVRENEKKNLKIEQDLLSVSSRSSF